MAPKIFFSKGTQLLLLKSTQEHSAEISKAMLKGCTQQAEGTLKAQEKNQAKTLRHAH